MSAKRTLSLVLLVATVLWAGTAGAATYYWDIDGSAAGSGGAMPSGSWDGLNGVWNSDSSGAGGAFIAAPTLTDDLVFSAGNDATGAYTATLTGSQSARTITFEDGTPLITGGTLTLAGGITTSQNAAIDSALTLAAGGQAWTAGVGNTLSVGGTVTRNVGATVDFSTTGTFNGAGLLAAVGTTVNGWATIGGTNWAISNGTNVAALASYTNSIAGTTAPGAAANVDFLASNSGAWSTQTINSLRFNTNAATTLNINSNQTLTISSGGILVTSNVGNFLSRILNSTIRGAAGRDLVITQNNTANDLTITSVIADNGSATGLVKSGPGNVNFTNRHTFTGGTTVNGGTLTLISPDTNGNGMLIGQLTINSGGTVNADIGWSLGFQNGFIGNIKVNGGTLNFTGTNNNGGTFASIVTMTGGTISGANYDWLGNANTTLATNASSTTATVSSGFRLRSGVNVTLNVAQGSAPGGVDLLISGNITTLSGLGITKAGEGMAVLSGVNTYVGNTTVNAGTLRLDKTGTGALSTGTPLVLGGGTFAIKAASSGATAQTLSSFSTTASTGSSITLDPNGGTGVTLTLANSWARGANSSLLFDYSSASTGTRAVNTAGTTSGATLTNGVYGWALVKDNAGVIGFATRAAAANSPILRFDDTTGTTLATNSNVATTNFTTLNTVYSSGTLAWSSGITTRSVNSLTIDTTNNGGTIDLGATGNILTLTSLGILFKGPGSEIVTGGQVGASGSEVIVHQTGGGLLTINSFISRATAGTGSLTKDGTGTLAVGANNVYSGVTVINGGTLQVNGDHGGAGAYIVNRSGTLGGSGSITTTTAGVTVNTGGKLAPGASAGTLDMFLGTAGVLDISGAVAASNSQSLLFELGSSSDMIAVSNSGATTALNIGTGALEFNDFVFTDLGDLSAGTYTLFDGNAAITGTLGQNLFGAINGSFNGSLQLANSNNDIVLSVSVVPEPASVSLLGIAALGLLARRRRQAA